MATICSRDPLKGFPFSNTFSVSDGASVAKSTGIPYFYVPSLEMSVHDLEVNIYLKTDVNGFRLHYDLKQL